MPTPIDVSSIAQKIIAEATKDAGAAWNKIKKTAPIFINGYAQNLADIASGVASGDIQQSDGKIYAQNARLMLDMGIAHTSQTTLSEIQTLMDNVLNTLKGSINAALPFAIL